MLALIKAKSFCQISREKNLIPLEVREGLFFNEGKQNLIYFWPLEASFIEKPRP